MRSECLNLRFLEPFDWRNQRAFGYDMYSESVRHKAMDSARDSGDAEISGKVVLVQETQKDIQAGFLMFLPVYRKNVALDTVAERRANIVGWVYEVFRMGDLMNGVFIHRPDDLDIRIYDGDSVTKDLMLELNPSKSTSVLPRYSSLQSINIAGHEWTLQFSSTPDLESRFDFYQPYWVAVVGLLVSLLFFALTWMQMNGRKRSISIALDLNRDLLDIRTQLQNENTKIQAILHNASDGIHILDQNGYLIEASDSFCNMLGYSRNEMIGMHVSEWDAKWSRAEVMEVLRKAFESGDTKRYEFESLHRRNDGSEFPVEISSQVYRSLGVNLLFNSSRDISDRKRAEQILKDNEQRLRDILDISPIAVRIATQRGRKVVFFNEGYGRLIKSSIPLGDDPRNYYVRVEDYDEILKELTQGRSVINRQIELRSKGETVWVLASYMPIQYLNEDAVLGWFYEITELKNAEREMRISATAFESQEAMLITDEKANIIRVNRAFTEITGFSAEDVTGKNPRMFQSDRQDAAFFQKMWKNLYELGHWAGEIWNCRKNGEIFPEYLTITAVKDVDGKVTNYVASFTDITHRKIAEKQIVQLAYYDHLTNLPNRRMLIDRLKLAMANADRSHRFGAILFMDLDNFKTINDTLGHDKGDDLLKQVAERAVSSLREGDMVARLGGDEFVVMLEDISSEESEASRLVMIVAEKLAESLSQPYMLGTQEYVCTSSIGITLFNGNRLELGELLKQADIAMYESKKAGRNTVHFYDARVQDAIVARAKLAADMRIGLDQQQFELYYQVQVDRDRKVFGAEALIRWNHPERGLLQPAEFIPIAEEEGLILPMGNWVIEAGCWQLMAWKGKEATKGMTLAVNVSASQFLQRDFVEQVRLAVEKYSINPSLLKLELTEGMLFENIDASITEMQKLRDIGILLSLDDFGTGYSSLNYLKRLPLNQIKIDQSFVRDLGHDENDRGIILTIIAMAKTLNLEVIAEGVETAEQKRFLEESGCTQYQGYLFGKPMPLEQIEFSLFQNEYKRKQE